MYVIKRTMYTETAHYIVGHPKACKFPHGHSYRWTVAIARETLNSFGMVMDFGDLKDIMKQTIGRFDHAFVVPQGEFPQFACAKLIHWTGNPTAESMAKQVFHDIKDQLRLKDRLLRVHYVTCRETKNNEAVYYEIPGA